MLLVLVELCGQVRQGWRGGGCGLGRGLWVREGVVAWYHVGGVGGSPRVAPAVPGDLRHLAVGGSLQPYWGGGLGSELVPSLEMVPGTGGEP